ncbi:MAG: LptF/LptG family permease [Pirellulales bacterium]
MRILTRYILGDFVLILIASLVGMTALILLVLVGREAVDQGLGLGPVLRLMPYALPMAMRYAVPGTVLLATTAVFGRFAASNEVVAVKSMGISPMALIWPMLALTAFVSLGAVWLNDLAVSWGRLGMQRVILESLEQTVYSILRTQKSYHTRQMTIVVRGVEGRRLIQPTITLRSNGRHSGGTISAEEAQLRADPEKGELTIELRDMVVDMGDDGGVWPGISDFVIPLQDLSQKGASSRRPSEIPLRLIHDEVVRQENELRALNRSFAAQSVCQLTTGNFVELGGSGLNSYRNKAAGMQNTLHRLHTEPHRRFSVGFSCLCFAVVGVPMAIRRKQGEFLASFFACFLPILLVYYPFLMVSVDHSKEGQWPPETVWIGNIVLVLWGVWLMRKVIRY